MITKQKQILDKQNKLVYVYKIGMPEEKNIKKLETKQTLQ